MGLSKSEFLLHDAGSIVHELRSPRFLVTLAVLTLFSGTITHLWIFEYPGLIGLDSLAAQAEPRASKHSQIVKVDEDDYETFFGGVSPLDSGMLDCVLDKLSLLGPAALVVDFDTESRRFQSLPRALPGRVWARGAAIGADDVAVPWRVLGGRKPEPDIWGVAMLPRDRDWTIREFPRYYRTAGEHWIPSLHWAAHEAFCRVPKDDVLCGSGAQARAGTERESTLEVQVFHSHYRFPERRLRDFVVVSRGSGVCGLIGNGGKVPTDNALHGQIVFLGGSYSPGDTHATPFGIQPGVEIVAAATEAELDPVKPGSMGTVAHYGFELFLGVMVAICHHYLRPRYALLATVTLLCSLVFLGSVLAFYWAAYRASAVPLVIGIWLEQLYESAEKAHRSTSGVHSH